MQSLWRIDLFGGVRATRLEETVTRFRTRKTAALLAYLALHKERHHSRDSLTELLWPEADAEQGRQNLRMALSSLRRQLEPPGIAPGSVIQATRTQV